MGTLAFGWSGIGVSKKIGTVVAALAATAVISVGTVWAATNLVDNGSFESGLSDWTATNVDWGTFWTASDGTYSIDLNGWVPGSISQEIDTVPGTVYTVKFDLAGNPGIAQIATLDASAAGTTESFEFDTTGKTGAAMGWTEESFTFVATDATTTIAFVSTTNIGEPFPDAATGPALDNIRVFGPDNKAAILSGSGVEGKGIADAPGLQETFNSKSKGAENAGKKN